MGPTFSGVCDDSVASDDAPRMLLVGDRLFRGAGLHASLRGVGTRVVQSSQVLIKFVLRWLESIMLRSVVGFCLLPGFAVVAMGSRGSTMVARLLT